MEIQRRRREGTPSMNETARTTPPPPSLQNFSRDGRTSDAVEAAVVFTVSAVVPLAPVVSAMLAGFKLQVGKLCAPVGDRVRVQATFIVPAYVLLAVKVTVPVALAPGETGDGAGAAIPT